MITAKDIIYAHIEDEQLKDVKIECANDKYYSEEDIDELQAYILRHVTCPDCGCKQCSGFKIELLEAFTKLRENFDEPDGIEDKDNPMWNGIGGQQ